MRAFKSSVNSIHELTPRVMSYEEDKERKTRKISGIIGKVIIFIILLIYAVALLVPFYVLLVTSITPYQELMGSCLL